MIPVAIALLISSGLQLIGSFVMGLWKSDEDDGRQRTSILAKWSMATSLLAIGILLIERLI